MTVKKAYISAGRLVPTKKKKKAKKKTTVKKKATKKTSKAVKKRLTIAGLIENEKIEAVATPTVAHPERFAWIDDSKPVVTTSVFKRHDPNKLVYLTAEELNQDFPELLQFLVGYANGFIKTNSNTNLNYIDSPTEMKKVLDKDSQLVLAYAYDSYGSSQSLHLNFLNNKEIFTVTVTVNKTTQGLTISQLSADAMKPEKIKIKTGQAITLQSYDVDDYRYDDGDPEDDNYAY